MRSLALFAFIAFSSLSLHAQVSAETETSERTDFRPAIFLGTSSGLENPSGILGVNFEVALVEKFSIGAGAGLSSWGNKLYGEVRYYLDDCYRGWAFGAGVTHNTGLADFEPQMPTTAGDKKVLVDLKPVTNGFISAYRFWRLGRRTNRFYTMGGYSFRFTDDVYTMKSDDKLSSQGEQAMKILAPGGLSLALGLSFDLSGRR